MPKDSGKWTLILENMRNSHNSSTAAVASYLLKNNEYIHYKSTTPLHRQSS